MDFNTLNYEQHREYRPFFTPLLTLEEKSYFAIIEHTSSHGVQYILFVSKNLPNKEDKNRILTKLRNNQVFIKQVVEVNHDKVREAMEINSRHENQSDFKMTGEAEKIFTEIINVALKRNVSDLHIEIRPGDTSKVLMRIDGELELYNTFSSEALHSMLSALYNTPDTKEKEDTAFNEGKSQQAIVQKKMMGELQEDIQLRYQSSPIFPAGFKVVMRILNLGNKDKQNEYSYKKLPELGYGKSHVQNIKNGVAKPVGATIIAGVTGSGKSTTLQHLMKWMNEMTNFRKSFNTLEDPPEYLIPGVTQIGVSRNDSKTDQSSFQGSPYKKPLAVMMRFDPDVIMLGEIRDEATAEGLVKATESGHKVLSTTHASSALEIIKRLYNFGIGSNDMASPSFMSCLIYQKLIPILCEHCKKPFKEIINESDVSEELVDLKSRLVQVADLDKDKIFVRNTKGCSHCNGRGVKGRTVCAETILPDLTLLTYFRDNKMIEAKEYWRKLSDGDPNSENFTGKTVLEHAIYKMRQGLFSPQDVEIELGPINAAFLEMQEIKKREESNRANLKFDQYVIGSLLNQQGEQEKSKFDLD